MSKNSVDILKKVSDRIAKNEPVSIALMDTMNDIVYLEQQSPYSQVFLLRAGGILQMIEPSVLQRLINEYPSFKDDVASGLIRIGIDDPAESNTLQEEALRMTAERMRSYSGEPETIATM